MLVSSSSSALTGPGFFLAGIPAAAGCGDEADVEAEGGAAFSLPPPSGSGNAGAEVEDGGGGPERTENVISGHFEDMFAG